MAKGRRPGLLGALLVVAGTLGVVNWQLAQQSIDISPIAASAPSVSRQNTTARDAPTPPPGSAAELSETTARPLFNATRRPAVAPPPAQADATAPAPEEPAAAAPSASKLSLAGVMLNGAQIRRALIRSESQPNGIWAEVGSEIGGWRITKIDDVRVVIEGSGSTEELRLHEAR